VRWHAAAVAVGLFVALAAVQLSSITRDYSMAHVDTARHLLMARECAEGAGCYPTLGPYVGGSVAGISHGPGIAYFDNYVLRWGGDLYAARIVLIILQSLAAALVFLAATCLAGPMAGAVATAILLVPTSLGFATPPEISNEGLVHLPAVMILLSALTWLRRPRPAVLALTGVLVGIGAMIHLSLGSLGLGLVVMSAASRPGERLRNAVIGLGSAFATVQVIAPGILRNSNFIGSLVNLTNAPNLQYNRGVNGVIVAVFVLIITYIAADRGRTCKGDPGLWFLILTYLPFLALLLALRSGATHYFTPYTPGAAVLAGIAAARLGGGWFVRVMRQWTGRALRWEWALVACSLPLALCSRIGDANRYTAGYTFDGIRAVAEFLARDLKLDHASACQAIHGGTSYDALIAGLGLYLPDGGGAPDDHLGVNVVGFPAGTLTQGKLATFAEQGWRTAFTSGWGSVLVQRYTPIIQRDAIRWCPFSDGPDRCAWQPFQYDCQFAKAHAKDEGSLGLRSVPSMHASRKAGGFLLRLPVVLPAGETPRFLVFPEARSHVPGATVIAVEGIRIREELPSGVVTLLPGADPQVGAVIVAYPRSRSDGELTLPPILELEDRELAGFLAPVTPPVVDQGRLAGIAREAVDATGEELTAIGAPMVPSRPEMRLPRWYVDAVCAAIAAVVLLSLISCLSAMLSRERPSA
jgi:hypothetical protein